MKATLPALLTLMFFPLAVSGAEIEWSPEANMDHQLFPALILATASVRPVEPEDGVDGSVVLASLLRKISIEPFLVTVPGHMYVGFYLGAGKSQFIAVETTLLGVADAADEKKPSDPAALSALRDKLDSAMKGRRDWKTFAKAIQAGTENLLKNEPKLDAADPNYQWIDLTEARSQGIMPIPYSAAP